MHSWSGNAKEVVKYLQAFPENLYFSLSQASLTEDSESILSMPLDRIVVETDSPSLCKPALLSEYGITPLLDSHHSPVNQPEYLPCSISKLAELLSRSEADLRSITFENTRKFLGN